MSRYRLTPRARQGLTGILDYVEREFGLDSAELVLDRLIAAFELIARQPGVGHIREDITEDRAVRFWSVGPTVIAYRTKEELVEILIVERGERDWIYDDIDKGFAQAKKAGKPLMLVFRCVP